MARLVTAGFELNEATNATSPDGAVQGGGAATITSATVRSGAFALSCASGAGNLNGYFSWSYTLAASRTYFARAYLNFSQFPTAATKILDAEGSGGGFLYIAVTSTGTLQLIDGGAVTQIGADSAALSLGVWYRVELSTIINGSTQVTGGAGRLEGAEFASGNIATPSAAGVGAFAGWVATPGANKTMFVDDVAVNDDQGGSQNTWPGEGRIVLLVPTATSASGTGWTLGTGTAEGGNGWNSVNNKPPVGVTNLEAGSDPKQIRNASSNANVNWDGTMTTYTAAGVAANATINVVDPIIATAAPVSTGAKQGTVGVVSNPVIANIALGPGGTSGAFWSGTTEGTYTTGWKWSHGTATYAPSVTLGTAPVMRVTQVTSSTRIATVCFMGMYVDFTPALAPHEQVALQAMNRATNF